MWGGLRPIRSRLVLDAASLILLGYCACAEVDAASAASLIGACTLTLATAGPTCRWTITLPLVPFLFLQLIRRLDFFGRHYWISWALQSSSVSIVLFSAVLTLIFPAVRLDPVKGEFNVGVVDFHIPLDVNLVGLSQNCSNSWERCGHVSVRLLYPTSDSRGSISYFDEDFASVLCDELVKVSAPPFLRRMGFILHTWRLTRIPARRNALPVVAAGSGRLPIAVHSHGITGNASIYSYQALNLASHGTVVLQVEHGDGSAIGLRRKDGSFLHYDSSIGALEREGKHIESVLRRRQQTECRIAELLSAVKTLRNLHQTNIEELRKIGISFVGGLDVEDLTLIGHSFGGGSVLAAAARRPDLVSCVVAHEPTVDWMPDDCRRALFAEERLSGLPLQYHGGTGGYEDNGDEMVDDEEKKESQCTRPVQCDGKDERYCLHDIDMFFLYSQQWTRQGWGGIALLKGMYGSGNLGPQPGVSEVGYIYGSHHTEFSDSCLMTPVWLGRATGLTGTRNPHDTAEEIASRTVDFMRSVRTHRSAALAKKGNT